MELGLVLRNMGDVAEAGILQRCAQAAEAAGLDSLWVTDHVAIPPDDAAGSNGRYLDPLATLAYLAAGTERIGLGTSVLILPYRPALPTAKWIATIQELSHARLTLGVGVGWMAAEFRALGVNRRARGAETDRALELINRCFADDVVEENGQRFYFRPRPPRPPILVGGKGPHALARAVRHGDGWLPGSMEPNDLAQPIERLAELAHAAGKESPKVVMMTALPLEDRGRAEARIAAYADAGVSGIIHAGRYASESEAVTLIDALARLAS